MQKPSAEDVRLGQIARQDSWLYYEEVSARLWTSRQIMEHIDHCEKAIKRLDKKAKKIKNGGQDATGRIRSKIKT